MSFLAEKKIFYKYPLNERILEVFMEGEIVDGEALQLLRLFGHLIADVIVDRLSEAPNSIPPETNKL